MGARATELGCGGFRIGSRWKHGLPGLAVLMLSSYRPCGQSHCGNNHRQHPWSCHESSAESIHYDRDTDHGSVLQRSTTAGACTSCASETVTVGADHLDGGISGSVEQIAQMTNLSRP